MSIIKVKPQTPSVSTVANTVANAVHSFEGRLPTVEEYNKIPTGSLIVVHSKADANSSLPGIKAVVESYYKGEPNPIVEDFAFIIYGDEYIVENRHDPYDEYSEATEIPNYIMDWGDGTQSIVDSEDESQRTHTYANVQEWTITIKNYVSGRIDFKWSENLRRILSPLPYSSTRTSFKSCFYKCTSLTTVPENLFANNINVASFDSCFLESGLTTIPEKLFAENVSVEFFGGCFKLCTSLTTVPENLFANNTNANYFSSCFSNCTSLTTIPVNLFANNLNAKHFDNCFYLCTSLTTVPENLFANNSNILHIGRCFYACRNLSNINIKLHPDVLNRDTKYENMFYVESPSYSHEGVAPKLWESATTTESYKTGCFRNNTALTNYADIPSAWK